MKIYDFQQGSDEWKNIRKGVITGTKAGLLFKDSNLKLIDLLISEQTSNFDESDYESGSMMWGIANEDFARKEYERATFNKVNTFGFCISEEYPYLGISPDGFVLDNQGNHIGGLEIKCPDCKTHCEYVRMGVVPSKYRDQVDHYFIVNPSIQWVDFVSYDPRNTLIKSFIVRVNRSEIEPVLKQKIEMILKFRIKWEKYLKQFKDLAL